MSEVKTLATWGPYTVTSDARDILVEGTKDFEVMSWSHKQAIAADKNQKIDGGGSIWRVKNDEQRTLFLLRWA